MKKASSPKKISPSEFRHSSSCTGREEFSQENSRNIWKVTQNCCFPDSLWEICSDKISSITSQSRGRKCRKDFWGKSFFLLYSYQKTTHKNQVIYMYRCCKNHNWKQTWAGINQWLEHHSRDRGCDKVGLKILILALKNKKKMIYILVYAEHWSCTKAMAWRKQSSRNIKSVLLHKLCVVQTLCQEELESLDRFNAW